MEFYLCGCFIALCHLDPVTANVYVAMLSLDGLCVIGIIDHTHCQLIVDKTFELASMRLD